MFRTRWFDTYWPTAHWPFFVICRNNDHHRHRIKRVSKAYLLKGFKILFKKCPQAKLLVSWVVWLYVVCVLLVKLFSHLRLHGWMGMTDDEWTRYLKIAPHRISPRHHRYHYIMFDDDVLVILFLNCWWCGWWWRWNCPCDALKKFNQSKINGMAEKCILIGTWSTYDFDDLYIVVLVVNMTSVCILILLWYFLMGYKYRK